MPLPDGAVDEPVVDEDEPVEGLPAEVDEPDELAGGLDEPEVDPDAPEEPLPVEDEVPPDEEEGEPEFDPPEDGEGAMTGRTLDPIEDKDMAVLPSKGIRPIARSIASFARLSRRFMYCHQNRAICPASFLSGLIGHS